MNDVIEVYLQDKFLRTRLADIRKSKGLSQKQLAEAAKLSIATISSIESGKNTYTLSSLIKCVEALGYEINIDKKVGDCNGNTEKSN